MPFADNGLYGYRTPSGVVIPAQFQFPAYFFGGIAVVCIPGRGCGPMDTKGKFLGLLQSAGSLIPSRYSEGLGAVLRVVGPTPVDQQHGYVDLNGNLAIPLQYSWAGDFDHGMAVIHQPHKSFFIDHSGARITPEFEVAYEFSEDLAPVRIKGKWGYIRRDGGIAIAPAFEGAEEFSEGLAAVVIGGKFGYIDTSGKLVIEPLYDIALRFSEGRAAVEVHRKWGYIDPAGTPVIPIQYPVAHTFHEGVASVMLDSGKWGYIDPSGKFEIPPVFDFAMPFCAGIADVETYKVIGPSLRVFDPRGDHVQGKHGMIDRSGKYIWADRVEQTWDTPF